MSVKSHMRGSSFHHPATRIIFRSGLLFSILRKSYNTLTYISIDIWLFDISGEAKEHQRLKTRI